MLVAINTSRHPTGEETPPVEDNFAAATIGLLVRRPFSSRTPRIKGARKFCDRRREAEGKHGYVVSTCSIQTFGERARPGGVSGADECSRFSAGTRARQEYSTAVRYG